MGNEFGQRQEWSHDRSLDWHLLDEPLHAGVQQLIRDLNRIYRSTPALYEIDFDQAGFEWLDWNDRDSSVFAWLRRDRSGGYVICVANMTPVVRDHYMIGAPSGGSYRVLIDTDGPDYGGSGAGRDSYEAAPQPAQGQPCSIDLRLPPLATLILQPIPEGD